jgi:16S rRNA (cytidine1402-2'-O)-methyltransferase
LPVQKNFITDLTYMKKQTAGTLYLIPKTIADCSPEMVIPEGVLRITGKLKFYIVENERTTRRYLSRIKPEHPIADIQLFLLNKHTKPEGLGEFIAPLLKGEDVGLMSEAGTPAVADPGAVIVAMAHRNHIRVVPLVGPSSILLALMASGLNGQNFSFNGYLPIDKYERAQKIRFYEKRSMTENQTQIFIETPFRNNQLLDDLLSSCKDNTDLCLAADLSAEEEFIRTLPISEWKKNRPDLNKQPVIFLLLGRSNRIKLRHQNIKDKR